MQPFLLKTKQIWEELTRVDTVTELGLKPMSYKVPPQLLPLLNLLCVLGEIQMPISLQGPCSNSLGL